jgi:hypothetical protein
MYSASSSLAYRAYATTFEALRATYFRREHVLQFPGHRRRDSLDEREFIAKENVNYEKDKLTSTDKEASNDPSKTAQEGSPTHTITLLLAQSLRYKMSWQQGIRFPSGRLGPV